MRTDLGFMSGDEVVFALTMDSEHNLVCKIRDSDDGQMWWAWDDKTFRMFQVSCGKHWVLNPKRTIWRGRQAYVWDDRYGWGRG
jgi:hypothetical protein